MIKLDIVSGFLGAGKTTFINKMLDVYAKDGEKVVFIVNEFGEANIDGGMVNEDLNVFELSNGCICCTLKLEFAQTLEKIIEELSPDRIIFEPSGIFVFSDFLNIVEGERFYNKCRVNKVITIIDALNFNKYYTKYSYYINNQIRFSNCLVLSKIEKSTLGIDEIAVNLATVNPYASITALPWNELNDKDIEELLNTEIDVFPKEKPKSVKVKMKAKTKSVGHLADFDTYSFYPEKEVTYEQLENGINSIINKECGNIIRAKGFVKADNALYIFNVVMDNYTIEKAKFPQDSRIAVIGKDIDVEKLNLLFSPS